MISAIQSSFKCQVLYQAIHSNSKERKQGNKQLEAEFLTKAIHSYGSSFVNFGCGRGDKKDKNVEIKLFYCRKPPTSPARSELEVLSEKDSILLGIDLTLPTTLEVLSSNPTFPNFSRREQFLHRNQRTLSRLKKLKMKSRNKLRKLSSDVQINTVLYTVSLAIHDKNSVHGGGIQMRPFLRTLLVFKEPSFLLPPPEPPDECLKNVVLNFYQSKKMFPLNVEDVSPSYLSIWLFFQFFTYTTSSPMIFSFQNENFIFDPGIITFHNPVAVSMNVSICSP
ncbi:hypothetical protein Tco_0175073 [Tanacetum coccineum]